MRTDLITLTTKLTTSFNIYAFPLLSFLFRELGANIYDDMQTICDINNNMYVTYIKHNNNNILYIDSIQK